MSKDQCPHCGGYCLPRWSRSLLGPFRSAPCRTCGEWVSVPFWSLFTAAPVIIAVAVVPQFITEPGLIALIAVALTWVADLLNEAFIPLIKSKY